MNGQNGNLRAIVVDDSPTCRELMVAILQIAEGIQVIGMGSSGEDAIRLVRRMRPDVILMDVAMPGMGGLEATRQVMSELPTPIVLVTGTLMHRDTNLSFKALRAGALSVVAKPGLDDVAACDALVETVRNMARVPVVRRWLPARETEAQRPAPAARDHPTYATAVPLAPPVRTIGDFIKRPVHVIGIASSTGGPGALAAILSPLPAEFPIPILVVQHVTPGFGAGLASWLDQETRVVVRLAAHGTRPTPGTVLIAPDAYHMQVNFQGIVELSHAEPYRGLRPSANYLFDSLARIYGPRAMGLILTGMGDDGVEGLKKLRQAGGLTVAQDQASCVVYGMPGEAVRCEAVDTVLTLDDIGKTLYSLSDRPRRQEEGQ